MSKKTITATPSKSVRKPETFRPGPKKKKRRPNKDTGSFQPTTWDEVEKRGKTAPTALVESDGLSEYPPPPNKKHPTFIARWNENIQNVVDRDNFKPGHLAQLEIFCDLHVEYEELSDLINERGYTYESHGRNGTQIKISPEVTQRTRAMSEIRAYAKILGLLLVKDNDLTDPKDKGKTKERGEWE